MGIEQNDRELFVSSHEGSDFISPNERRVCAGQKKDYHRDRNGSNELSSAQRGGALCYHRRVSGR